MRWAAQGRQALSEGAAQYVVTLGAAVDYARGLAVSQSTRTNVHATNIMVRFMRAVRPGVTYNSIRGNNCFASPLHVDKTIKGRRS